MKYVFKYRKSDSWFWKKEEVVGHRYEPLIIIDNKAYEQDKMILYFADGGLMEIVNWKKEYEVKLGQDWVLAIKKNMESKIGQQLPLSSEIEIK
jgi:hypothetical protein